MSTIKDIGPELPSRRGVAVPPPLEFDPAEYLDDMRDLEIDEVAKIELLRVIWDIMRSFVEMSVDIRNFDPCGQLFADEDDAALPSPSEVKSTFTTATRSEDRK